MTAYFISLFQSIDLFVQQVPNAFRNTSLYILIVYVEKLFMYKILKS